MRAEWIKSPTARLVLVHWADARPAWLWSQDGETLLWRNDAARYFHGKIKKHGLKLAPEAVPIKGQIARLIRLGSMGRSSLSRIQFLAGERPISTTCTCTPLELQSGEVGLLIVGVDPIEPELLEAHDPMQADAVTAKLLPDGAEFLLVSEDGQIAGGSRHAIEHFAPIIESEGLPHDAESAEVALAGDTVLLSRFKASPHDAMLLLFERHAAATPQIAEVRAEEGVVAREDTPVLPPRLVPEPEPLLPMGLPPVEHADDEPVIAEEDNWVEPIPAAPEVPGTLASLFDRLADDGGLYTALGAGDEHFAGPPPEAVEAPLVPEAVEADEALPLPELPAEEPAVAVPPMPEQDVIAALIDFADEEEAEPEPEPDAAEPVAATVWRVIGRGFEAVQDQPAEDRPEALPTAPPPVDEEPVETVAAVPDAETVERVSRYNFDELSRILTDRVSAHPSTPPAEAPAPPASGNEGALINLNGETFILNRLPLGILVFRDQQVLFANRALTDLTGYESIESLRAAGLTAIFPSEDSAVAGPVTQLVRRDGSLATVNARLQSITWHGRPALMLSAGVAENRIGHEAAVRSFAELAAETGDDGFLAADRSGTITSVSLHGRIVLGHVEEDIVGKPLASFIEPSQLGELKRFLERPARFAETARPAILFDGAVPNTRLTLFAEGQAGIIAGYYAFVRKAASPAVPAPPQPVADDLEPSMLTRISRGVRRPLNTVIGFADLIRSASFGSIENQRYLEYAQDIKTAGQEIADLVDELDDYSRLREGRYPAEANDIDLVTLLESCLARVRGQAGEARVLVRNAVSERLPRITADTASLTQAILNLLASAIDQTPVGGSVILSAQQEDDGAVIVNVRDGGEARRDLGERFVVFRDGVGKDGETLQPVRSSVGLALTRSLLAVNALQLSVDPAVGVGTMFSLLIPAELVRETGQ